MGEALTRRYPFLGTGPVSTEPYVSPAYFELERERIFRREWLNLGRESDIPKPRDFVVREIEICNASIIVVRGEDGRIRAFHNICSHRGMRLVNATAGARAAFVCPYHGWTYGTDGAVRTITAEDDFFDLDRADCALTAVACETWNGFVFVNLARKPEKSLQEFLGGWGDFAAGYPFDRADAPCVMTAILESNWKVAVDAFQEFYHAVFLHVRTQRNMYYTPADRSGRIRSIDLYGPHRRYSAATNPDYRIPEGAHIERLVGKYGRNINAGAHGDTARAPITSLCPGLNPTRDRNWAWDQTFVFPNTILTLTSEVWVMSQFWPISPARCRWENTTYVPKPQKPSERFAREYGFAHMRDVAAEDIGTTEGTTRALMSGGKDRLYLQDNEIAIRHMLHTVEQYVRPGPARAAAE